VVIDGLSCSLTLTALSTLVPTKKSGFVDAALFPVSEDAAEERRRPGHRSFLEGKAEMREP
jgi:hypothetical protein